MTNPNPAIIARRFRGFLPVVIDVETGGFNAKTDALLEVAAVLVGMDEKGFAHRKSTVAFHVQPFPGANMEPEALAFNGIDPDHPFRGAVPEHDALKEVFNAVRHEMRDTGCHRAILVGHNPTFDLNFVNAAAERAGLKRNPFHPFSTFDTATLGGLAFGQTVLARAAKAAGLNWRNSEAHSAIHDAEKTADLFCTIVNLWQQRSVDSVCPWLDSDID